MTNPPLRKQTLSTWTTISAIREIILLGPVCGGEIGSKSTERHEITEMHVFFFSLPFPYLHSLASANYLCASYTGYVLEGFTLR